METMILVWIIGLLDFCMEKSNHKPIFFDEFGSKRTLLGILVVFGSFRLDLELFLLAQGYLSLRF